MKIKELIESIRIKNETEKAALARRIKNCSPLIRKAITRLTKEGELDPVSITVDYPEGDGYIVISSLELVQNFGMTEMEALLFVDAILKANKKKDKSELFLLLGRLTDGEHVPSEPLSESMMEKIKTDNPQVWEEYIRICDEEQRKHAISTSELNALMEEDV